MIFPSPPKANDVSIAQQWFKMIDILREVYNLFAPAYVTETFADGAPLAEDVDLLRDGKFPKQIRVAVGGTVSVVYADDSTDTITYQGGDVDRIAPRQITQAGTTAQNITVYW